jgi:hypothetical protein
MSTLKIGKVCRIFMARTEKKFYIFTDQQWAELHEIVTNLAIEIQRFLDEYSNPKEFAKQYVEILEPKAIAFYFLIELSLNMKPDSPASLKELMKKLPEELQDRTGSHYLNERQLREALNVLQKEGYYIKSREIRRPGRPKSDKNILSTSRGRPPAMYRITEQVAKLQKFLSNSAAQAYIHSRLQKHGLSQQFFKFLILSFMYAVRNEIDYTKMFELLKIVPFFREVVKDESSWKDFLNDILSSDESQMNSDAEKSSLNLAENPIIHIYSLNALSNVKSI